ncbi:hypothetical protein H0H93_004641 [Arthromyces matolae]|nr:hypothetical protein H0H93_004641 [Arthromyces matolae]
MASLEPPADLDSQSSRKYLSTKAVKSQPPKLQHSPSLPNICPRARFPPHSGPLPSRFEDTVREPLRRLSTPPTCLVPEQKYFTGAKSSEGTLITHSRESLSFDHAEHLQRQLPLKFSMRRRTDHQDGHDNPLLTPPLTPSSSLKTAASHDSNTDSGGENPGVEADAKSTRFLLLQNLSKRISHDKLRDSLIQALTSPRRSSAASRENGSQYNTSLAEDSIKGIFLRGQQSNGFAVLAFFDVRHAEIAQQIISIPATDSLTPCVGDNIIGDGTRAWIACQFISAKQLEKDIGKSSFITATDASFLLGVGGTSYSNSVNETKYISDAADRSNCDEELNPDPVVIEKTNWDLNIPMLKKILKSFGGLRFFSLAKDIEGHRQFSNEIIFRVEYYDVRHADTAYRSVHKQALFGMRLRAFGKDFSDSGSGSAPIHQMAPMSPEYVSETTSPSSDRDVATTSTDDVSEFVSQIGYPGEYSQIRERLYVDGPPSQVHPSTDQAQEMLANSDLHSPVPSPTFFYRSDPAIDLAVAGVSNDNLSHPHGICYNTAYQNGGRQWVWDNGGHPHLHECSYFPSRTSPALNPAASYYLPCPTPAPYCHHQGQQTPLPFVPPHPHVYGYTCDSSHYQHIPTLTPYPGTAGLMYENGIMEAPPRGGEIWYPEVPASFSGTPGPMYFGPQPPVARSPFIHEPNGLPESADIYRPNLSNMGSGPSRRASQPMLHGNPGQAPHQPQENNLLDISKIEDGRDTRTTVMIKNIPNKMSDKDLVNFIGKVCQRKIDFLYLRMDFKNGCNVGYAFVNFITVQDLLTFAKKKLGVKWNMFSSEKVLQMSYANYQGKEALVEKFKNSAIMDEQEAWRPKIFYSDAGPEQGLPEPFPAPTHIKRKERSASNRGALYVPGIGRGAMSAQSISPTNRHASGLYPASGYRQHAPAKQSR